MDAHTRLELKWFSKTRMNRDFLDEAVERASRIKEVKVNWIWKNVKWTDKWSTRKFIMAEVENGSRKCYLVVLSPKLRKMYCECKDFKYRCSNHNRVFYPCKHIWAVISALNGGKDVVGM